MYWRRSRALSMTSPVRPAAAPTTSFIAGGILLPASRLISCAFAAISATVSFTSAPRWPGLRLGGTTGGGVAVPTTTAGAGAVGVATAGFSLSGIYGLRSAQRGGADGYQITEVGLGPQSGANAAKQRSFMD